MNKDDRGIEINLFQLVRKLFENVKYIILVTCIFSILGYAFSAIFMTPIYQAGAKMIVNSRKDQSQNITNDQLNSARNLVETYAVIIRGRDVLNQVKAELNLQESYEQLAGSITVKSVNNTPIMQVYVRHSNRDTALNIAAKLLDIAPRVLEETAEAGSVKPVEQAYADSEPVSPSILRNTVLMAFLGCLFTCLLIFILMLTDNTYKSDLEIQRDLDVPVLGVIPAFECCKSHIAHQRIKKGEKSV